MLEVAQQIRQEIVAAEPRLRAMAPELAARKERADAWSRKQILGHLVDSCANNHQRVVRGARNAALDFPPYDQVGWVEVQRYQEASWPDLVQLFLAVHRHLCRVIECLPADALANPVNIGKDQPVTVEFVVTDYLRHLKLHLGDILGTVEQPRESASLETRP